MSHYDEHAGFARRRIGVGLFLAAAALALTATSPVASADTIDIPDLPIDTAAGTDQTELGVPPLFGETTFDQQATYTDLLGVNVDTSTLTHPLQVVLYTYPGTAPSIAGEGITDPNPVVSTLSDGSVGGSTFGVTATTSGLYNLYESTPFYPTGGGDTPSINDTWLYDPTAGASLGLPTDSTLDFGVQYLDLPDAATPVDELNFFGSGGEILFSIPVTGDLLSSL